MIPKRKLLFFSHELQLLKKTEMIKLLFCFHVKYLAYITDNLDKIFLKTVLVTWYVEQHKCFILMLSFKILKLNSINFILQCDNGILYHARIKR